MITKITTIKLDERMKCSDLGSFKKMTHTNCHKSKGEVCLHIEHKNGKKTTSSHSNECLACQSVPEPEFKVAFTTEGAC